MKTPRTRIETEHPDVAKYVFKDGKEVMDTDTLAKISRYEELRAKAGRYDLAGGEQVRSIDETEIEEIRRLREELAEHFRSVMDSKPRSVLSASQGESDQPWRRGTDSHVYESDTGKFVHKYSVPSYEAKPESIEYLRKKYELLKKYLGDAVPQSAFFLGERTKGFHKTEPEKMFDRSDRVITIQRRVSGKTFKDMTAEERMHPDVVEALRLAHAQYMTAKRIIMDTCLLKNVDPKTLDIKLDIGFLSKKEGDHLFDIKNIATFASPNVMYDPQTNKITFIDFGLGEWDDAKEKVFAFIMNKPERATIESAA